MKKTLFALLSILIHSSLYAQTSLSQIETYLNSIQTLQGNFQQMSPSGELMRGHFAIQKPGRMRLDYTSPSSQIIFAHEGQLYFYDQNTLDLSQTSLDQSLAEFLLRNNIEFNETIKVKSFVEDEETVALTLQKAGGEDLGELSLVFQLNPLRLIQWMIVDAQGQKTVVNLSNTKKNQSVQITTDPQQIVQR